MALSGIDFNTLGLYGTTKPPSKELGKDAFLELLVAQLKHQDPLDPLKDQEFINQLAQLTALEASTNLNRNVAAFIAAQGAIQSVNFIGKNVAAMDESGNLVEGDVTEVTIVDGQPLLIVNGTPVKMENILSVMLGTPDTGDGL